MIQEEHDLIGKLVGPIWDKSAIAIGALCLGDKIPDMASTRAYCYPHKLHQADAYVIAKQKGLPPALSVFADGHESGHLLEKMGQHQVLAELLKTDGIDIDSTPFAGEDFADIAGYLALVRSRIRDLPEFKHRKTEREKISALFHFRG